MLGNLSTHTPTALYQTYPPGETLRVLRRLEFDNIPKHASRLNMVEIEIGVQKKLCLSRRIGDRGALRDDAPFLASLAHTVAGGPRRSRWIEAGPVLQGQHHSARARIRWLFIGERARSQNAPGVLNAGQRTEAHPRRPEPVTFRVSGYSPLPPTFARSASQTRMGVANPFWT